MSKKQKMKQKVQSILIQIHRGFLTQEQSDGLSDDEILKHVPDNKGSFERFERVGDEDSPHLEARTTPFSYKWVKIKLKNNPEMTAYDMLVLAGFKDK